MTIDAFEQNLPSELEITVKYGSGTESYNPKAPNTNSKVVYCDAYRAEGGEASFERIVCTLWTDGAATLRIQAKGYPEFVRELSASRDDCGIILKEEHLTLEHAD